MNCKNRERRVAVLVEMSSAHGRGIIRGISEYARRNLEITIQLEESGPLREVPRWFESWTGDGIIGRVETDEMAEVLLKRNVPVVNVSGRAAPKGAFHVDTDNRGIAEVAVDYFVKRGFRNFAYVGSGEFDWSQWRQRAFEAALEGIRAVPACYELTEGLPGATALEDWLRSLPNPVGLLACNDLAARKVLQACAKGGLMVPGQVAVLGVDNDEILCTLGEPSLSSVVPDAEAIGFRAMSTLHAEMKGEFNGQAEQWILPIAIQTRGSTDAAASEDWVIRQALRFIHGNAFGDIGVGEVVGHVGVSRRLLEQRFRKVLGRAVHDEIQRVRLEEAQRLLMATGLPLKEVAMRSGFKRGDYLSAVFREKLGVSPSEYRLGMR